MTRYYFTTEQRRKGGKARAAQAALARIAAPTQAEALARAAMALLTPAAEYEKPVVTGDNLIQYIDIYGVVEERQVAIEVDGSKGWHTTNGKMAHYDELKARWCHEHGVILVVLTANHAKLPVEKLAEHIHACARHAIGVYNEICNRLDV